MISFIVVIAWIACGVLAYGITFAFFQRRFRLLAEESYRTDMGFAIAIGISGPLGLVASFLLSGLAEHGLKFK